MNMLLLATVVVLLKAYFCYMAALLCELGAMKSRHEPRKSRFRKAQKVFVCISVGFAAAFIVLFTCVVIRWQC